MEDEEFDFNEEGFEGDDLEEEDKEEGDIYDFGIEDESDMLQQEPDVSDLMFVREIFPKVFGSQWGEVIPQTKQPVFFEARTLLGMAMDNTLIDWSHGGETLHLIYCIEVLLHKLYSKGWDIIVCFFNVLPYDHTSTPEQRLAVEILKQHLRSCSQIKNSDDKQLLEIIEFENWWEDAWRKCVVERHPSFIVIDLPLIHSEEDSDEISYEDVQKIFLLDMLAQNIRSISSEFRVTSNIWSFELTLRLPFATNCLASLHEELSKRTLFTKSDTSNENQIDINGDLVSHAQKDSNLSDLIIAITIGNILRKEESMEDLCKCFLLCNGLTRDVSLRSRLQQNSLVEIPDADSERIKGFFGLFTSQAFKTIQQLLHTQSEPLSRAEMAALSDLIDGRLFFTLFTKICCASNGAVKSSEDVGWKKDTQERIQSIWSLVSKFCSRDSPLFPVSLHVDANKVEAHQKSVEERNNVTKKDTPRLVNISDEFIKDMAAEDIENRIKENNLLSEGKEYDTFVDNEQLDQLAYYHADEPDEPETPVEVVPQRLTRKQKFYERKNRQKYYTFTEKVSESLSGKGTTVHHVVSARSDAVTLKSLEEELKEKEAQESKEKGKKGKGKGRSGKGGKGGKGKKGHIDRKAQIIAKNKEKMLQADKEQVQLALNSASEEEKVEDRIFLLSKKLKALRSKVEDSALVAGYMQLIEWSMVQWREECVVLDSEDDLDDFEEVDISLARKYTGAVQVFRISYDTVQLYAEHMSPADIRKIQHYFYVLGFPSAAKEICQFYVLKNNGEKEKESRYRPKKLTTLEKALNLKMSFATFQMLHCGHLMQRSFDSKPDPRVSGFQPDAWQRELLDIVDSKQSALVVAPTSSGKTFISYYTMKQVIEANKKNKYQSKAKLVIYIAPTKALVRQVAAEVYAHYGPIVGIQTTTYEQSAENCQVLVTVPQCLEELLLDPTWNSKKIAYCILDEIHCIQEFGTGEQSLDEGGSIVWEHVINLLPCPFLALSATIGNPQRFRDWLSFSQERYNREVRVVTHKYRWADLKLQVYNPNEEDRSLLDIKSTIEAPPESNLSHLHPVASLSLNTIQNEDSLYHLRLSPEECYQLYHVLDQFTQGTNEELKALNPDTYFKGLILRYDVFAYEKLLKDLIVAWSKDESKVDIIVNTLAQLSGDVHATGAEYPCGPQFTYEYFLSLLVELHNDEKLPALVFSLDRHRCNRLVTDLINKLEELETLEAQKPDYQRKLREYQKQKQKRDKKARKKRDEDEKLAKHAADAHEDDSFEVELPGKDERFSFLRKGEGALEEDKEYWLKRIAITSPFIETLVSGLDRGIGVHHGALPSSYRTAVEVLFRGGHLKVVISTGTLSLGINMPCKTVVFAGDSHALTPLSFQQMSGRAGRRGYDDYGNIVFFGISQYRVFSLLCAQLTTLTGGQPINPTVTLRLLNCYYQTEQSERREIAERLRGLLSPSLYSTNLDEKEAAIHRYHSRWLFRIYVDILIRLPLLEKNSLVPTNIAALTMKLFNTEPSNLLMSYFFLSGAIDSVCNQVDNQQARLNNLFLILCHVFRPIPVTAYLASLIKQNQVEASSLIVLPELSEQHKQLLANYNSQIIQQFVKCILSAHEMEDTTSKQQSALPFSQAPIGASTNDCVSTTAQQNSLATQLCQGNRKIVIRSPFVALSGHSDEFNSAQELADTCNLSLPIDIEQIPAFSVQDVRGRNLHLNAYAWDFLKHGKKKLLVHENGFKEANAWELIRDWSEILQKLSLYLAELPKNEDDQLKRVCHLFDFLNNEFKEKFERFNN